MNVYRNRKTGAIIEIPSEFGSNEAWELISEPAPAVAKEEKPKPVKAEPAAKKVAAPKKTATRKAVKK